MPKKDHKKDPKSEGNIVVISNRKSFSKIRSMVGNRINSFWHFSSIQEALESLHQRRDMHLVFVHDNVLRRSEASLDWIKSNLGDVEIIVLNDRDKEEIDERELVQRGREGAFDIFNMGDFQERKPEFLEKSLDAIKHSIERQLRPIQNIFVLPNDHIFLREVIDGVDIFSQEFWDLRRCNEYSDSRPPAEIRIEHCNVAEQSRGMKFLGYSRAQHRIVKNGNTPIFHVKIFTNPKESGGEYIAPAIYEADLELREDEDLEKRLGGKPSFPVVKYEGFTKTKSGLFYTMKHNKSSTIDYYFLLYTPRIWDQKEEMTEIEMVIQNVYEIVTDCAELEEPDKATLVSQIRAVAGNYLVLDEDTLESGAEDILKSFSSGEPLPPLEKLIEGEQQNQIFARLYEVQKEKQTNIQNYERGRDKLIYEALYAIAENDARWTAYEDKIAENLKRLTGDKNAKITDFAFEEKKNRNRLGRYLKNIFLFRCERDLKKGPNREVDINAVDNFSLFSPEMETSVSENEFEKVKDLFAGVLNERDMFVMTQGDMRLQHIFYDMRSGPEVFDYGRAKKERRGTSAVEFLIDHVLDLNCAEIEHFLFRYYDRFFERYNTYSDASGKDRNMGIRLDDEESRKRERKKEIRACFLLGILYRFRKMGPAARDVLRNSDAPNVYPVERVSYPYPVDITAGGKTSTLDQNTYREIDPNKYYSAEYLVNYHLSEIRDILEGVLDDSDLGEHEQSDSENSETESPVQGRRYLTKKDKRALGILHKMLSSHEICIETQGQVIKKRINLYDNRCEPYQVNGG